MKKEMLINVLQPEECRIAIVEDGVLEELYVERTSHESYVGNIYKGRVVNIEPSIQAAFVDFGVGRNGFLHVSDVEPQYYRHLLEGEGGNGDRRGGPRGRGRLPDLPDIELKDVVEDVDDDEAPASHKAPSGAPAEPVPRPEPRRPEPRRDEPHAFGAGLDLPETPDPDDGEDDVPPERMPSAERRGGEDDDDTNGSAEAEAEPDSREETEVSVSAEKEGAADAADKPARRGRRRRGRGSRRKPKDAPENEERAEPDDQERADDEDQSDAMDREESSDFDEREASRDDLEVMATRADEEEHGDDPRSRGRGRGRGRPRRGGRPGPFQARPKPPIQEIFRRGQEVLVQVIKEGVGTKGPTLSTYISIPGRYLVLMPGLNRIGVSRKIVDEEQRRRLRELVNELEPPKGLGFIIRTAGLDKNKKELQRDLAYLARLWKVVVGRIKKTKAPAMIYEESDMITRTIRDIFTSEIETIWVDEQKAFDHAQEFLTIVMPRYAPRIKLYADSEPLFHKYRIEEEIARIQRRHVPLPYGGSIVIDQTEALVAIDVNSGNFRADNNAEETAYRMNLQAAKEIARQLRLRDLGGVIVNDFIDMREERHRREVERAMRDAVKRDRARTKILKISAFGIIEMTRQRIRPSLKRSVYEDCPHCTGTGQVKTSESMSIDVMRLLQLAAHREAVARVQIRVTEAVAHYLLNKKRKEVTQLEESGQMQVTITGLPAAAPETLEMVCLDSHGNEVKLQSVAESGLLRRQE